MPNSIEVTGQPSALPIPQDISEGVRKRMKNLIQYSGKKKRTSENADEFLSEQPIPISVVKAEIMPDRMVDVPVVRTQGIEGTIMVPITMQAILRKDEFKVFVGEITEWMQSHPDWTLKEDVDDIHGIAMEKVIQYRLLLDKRLHPRTDIDKDFHASHLRMQSFRQNLAARRADRISGKGAKVVNQTNIAIIASQLDADKLGEMKKRVERLNQEEDEAFRLQANEEN
jgi:hypothetical protein